MTTIHVLPNPSGVTNENYRMDAFGIATSKFIKTIPKFGYRLIHYGHELSEVECDNIPIIFNKDNPIDTNTGNLLEHKEDIAKLYCDRLRETLYSTKSSGDLVACFYGWSVKDALTPHGDLVITEPSIGYPAEAVFSNYRAFVSHAWMHYYYGTKKQLMEPNWYDDVIPNAFDPTEFEYCEDKDDYFVYLGRMVQSKGIDLAIQITERLGVKLIIASPGKLKDIGYESTPSHVEEIGYVDCDARKKILAKAKCLIAPTYYIEPFGNMVVEAGLSGTPVLTSDWGGFSETVAHGATGFRCRDFNGFLKAANLVLEGKIKSHNCRKYTESNYNLDIIHRKMDAWFRRIKANDFYYTDQ